MTYCPNCGSGNIYLKRQTTFGYGAVGNRHSFVATGGSDENYQNACMNCGHTWDAKELFNILKLASGIVEQEIDLRYPNHRSFIQEVSQELSSYLYLEKKLQNEVRQELSGIKNQPVCLLPFVITIVCFLSKAPLIVTLFGVFMIFIVAIADSKKKGYNLQKQISIEGEAQQKKEKLRYNFGQNLHKIGTKYGLIGYELPPHPTQTIHPGWINKDLGI